MAYEDKDNKDNGTRKISNTAQFINGAYKTGKSISNVAKGAATSGPYGAIIGALWASKNNIIKIALAIISLIILPVLFLLLLPGLVFGGFSAGSAESNQLPILNNATAIMDNVNDLSVAITAILNEGLEDVKIRINQDFNSSGGDEMEIINPYSLSPTFNANLLISQYCAANDLNYKIISKSDLEKVLKKSKHHLYSYKRTIEKRQVSHTNKSTGKTTTSTKTYIIYTIIYNGEDYFADNIFKLTEKQKNLAKDYAYNLSIFLGDGSYQGIVGDNNIIDSSYDGIVFSDSLTPIVYYNQLDKRFANELYGTDKIGTHGCGPTAMSIIISSLTSKTIDPIQMSAWAVENGYWCEHSGSYHSLIPGAAKAWNLNVEGCTKSESKKLVEALSSGKLVVAIMSKGHFTKTGHFIVLRGITSNGKILVADPASYNRSQKEWDLSIILNEASKRASSGGPFWIISKKQN